MAITSRRQQARAQQSADNTRDPRRGQPAEMPFWPLEVRLTLDGHAAPLSLCGVCCAVVPASPGAQQRHLAALHGGGS